MQHKSSLAGFERGLSAVINWFARNQLLGFLLIGAYRLYYRINTDEMVMPWWKYRSLSEFFVREIRLSSHRKKPTNDAFCSPCDGTITLMGAINQLNSIDVKGVGFSPSDLVTPENFELVKDGQLISIYLAPHQYHRVHLPMALRLVDEQHIPGRIRSVKPALFAKYPFLLSENERRIYRFETESGQTFIMVLIGAFIVSSIENILDERLRTEGLGVGEALAQFNFGSSVVMMAEAGVLPDLNCQQPTPVQVHDPLVRF